jgi:hypothetical protein
MAGGGLSDSLNRLQLEAQREVTHQRPPPANSSVPAYLRLLSQCLELLASLPSPPPSALCGIDSPSLLHELWHCGIFAESSARALALRALTLLLPALAVVTEGTPTNLAVPAGESSAREDSSPFPPATEALRSLAWAMYQRLASQKVHSSYLTFFTSEFQFSIFNFQVEEGVMEAWRAVVAAGALGRGHHEDQQGGRLRSVMMAHLLRGTR